MDEVIMNNEEIEEVDTLNEDMDESLDNSVEEDDEECSGVGVIIGGALACIGVGVAGAIMGGKFIARMKAQHDANLQKKIIDDIKNHPEDYDQDPEMYTTRWNPRLKRWEARLKTDEEIDAEEAAEVEENETDSEKK